MFSPKDFAMQMINRNPNIANNPQAQEFMKVIQSGDQVRGRQIAENLCKTYGVSPEEALAQAKDFFRIG